MANRIRKYTDDLLTSVYIYVLEIYCYRFPVLLFSILEFFRLETYERCEILCLVFDFQMAVACRIKKIILTW